MDVAPPHDGELWLRRWDSGLMNESTSGIRGHYTVTEVSDACGLPGPAVMQLVPRTWTALGWMYTAEQMAAAVTIAETLRDDCGPGPL